MSSISAYGNITVCYRPEGSIPNHQPTGNLELSQNRIDDKDTASASREKKQSQLSDPMQKQILCTPTQTPNEANSYEGDNTKGDTQEDTVWGGVQEMYLNYFRGLEGHGEAKTGLPEPMKDHGEAKIDSPQPADTVAVSKHVLPVTQENSSANLTTFLGVVSPPSKVLTISDAMISRGQLKYLVSWLPSCYMIKDLRRLRSPSHKSFVSAFGPIAVICWYPTWVSAVDIPPKRLALYYAGKPLLLRRHAKIYKPLKDVIMEIAKNKQGDQLGEALEDLSEEILKRRVRKRKADYTGDGDSKKPKK